MCQALKCSMLSLSVLVVALSPPFARAGDGELIDAVDQEVQRAFQVFEKQTPALYYLSCGVTDVEWLHLGSSFGALTADRLDRSRILDVNARCGSYHRDNTHPLPGHTWNDYRWGSEEMPLDNDPLPIRMALWRAIESEYRKSAERLAQVQALDITKAALRDKSDDFSKGKALHGTEPRALLKADREAWQDKVRRYTLPFRDYPHIYAASATLSAGAGTRTFVDTEGARQQFSQAGYHLHVQVMTRSDDGLDLPLYESFFAWEPSGMPSDERVMSAVTNLAQLAEKLRVAPLVEPYAGPAILQGVAAAVFMHEVLGHRLEGHRQKDEKESQTFRGMVGKSVMADFVSVIFDPTIKSYKGIVLSGAYPYDEEGTMSRRVVAVENGILKSFLMSRSPIENFPESNGHGRAAAGMPVVSRQSNLIVESSRTVPRAKLRELLVEECRKRDKPYGLLFTKVEGGFTMTGRVTPNAFNVMPLVVYRIYTDGRPDELVRGVDIIGTPLTSLTKIIATGDDLSVFNGFCGAESGPVPVGAVSPSILLREIEVQKKKISQASPPVLPAPDSEKAGVKP